MRMRYKEFWFNQHNSNRISFWYRTKSLIQKEPMKKLSQEIIHLIQVWINSSQVLTKLEVWIVNLEKS